MKSHVWVHWASWEMARFESEGLRLREAQVSIDSSFQVLVLKGRALLRGCGDELDAGTPGGSDSEEC